MTTQPSDWAVARALERLSARRDWGYGRLRSPVILMAEVMELARELDASGTTNSVQISSSLVVGEALDAVRYQWIAANATRMAFYPDGEEHEVEWVTTLGDIGHDPTLDAAIDAAMGAVGAGGGE